MIYRIFIHQFVRSFSSPRTYLGILIGCLAQILSSMPLYTYSETIGKPLGIFEGFIYLNCDTYTSVVAFLGLLLFISDIPFSSTGEAYILLRTTKSRWTVGKIIYLFVGTCIYYIVVLFVGVLFLLPNAFLGNIWSEPLRFLTTASKDMVNTYHVFFPYQHVMQLPVYTVALICYFFSIAYGFIMSLLVFLLNLRFTRSIGYAATMIFHIISYAFAALFPSDAARKYSLLGNSLIMYHNIGGYYKDSTLPTVAGSFLGYMGIGILLVIGVIYSVKKSDLNITAGIYHDV